MRQLRIGAPASVLLISLLAGIIFSGFSSTPPRRPNQPVLGTSTQTGQYQLVVNNISIGQTNASSQKKRINLSVSLTNLSTTTLQISPGIQMTLSDQYSVSYPMTAGYLAYRQILGGPLNPKAKASYGVDFNIPASSTPTAFSFQIDGNTKPSVIG